ncbi:MAG: HAD hydrolase family protein [Bdellovibrionaceae bacterium]|nr:HAD hydrolase family protein [Pseudobdellovibrionaceae bacterium]
MSLIRNNFFAKGEEFVNNEGMNLSSDIIKRLSKIKMLVMDVDGVMTDGRIILGFNGEWCRFYSVRDGAGIVFLIKAGYQTGIITGANSPDVDRRAQHLKIHHVFKNHADKSPAYDEIKKTTGYTNEEICYIGDDIFDVPLLKQVGFAVTVPGGMAEAKAASHYVTTHVEGAGAIRELCDMIVAHGFYSRQGV